MNTRRKTFSDGLKRYMPSILAASLWAASAAGADIGKGMDAMWNSTAPAAAGVNGNYGGTLGGLSLRSPVRSFNIMAFDPPRFSAGCGGIDAYFGSFSMISEKNLKDLIRAIIANGTGYAAKIALDNLCPPCQNIMSGLQDWTTKINSAAKNTCQLGTAAVDYLRGSRNPSAAADDSKANEEAVSAAASGAAKDFAEANDSRSYKGKNANRADDAADQSTDYGNNMMNTLVSAGVFGGAQPVIDTRPYGGDQGFLEMAMSLYGTQILLTGADASSSASGGKFTKGSQEKTDKDLAPIWTFADVVNGAPSNAALTQYRCKDFNAGKADSCQHVSTADSSFPGTYRYILNLLIGKQTAYSDSNAMGDSVATQIQPGSLMAYFADNDAQTLTPEQQAFLKKLPKEASDVLSQAARAGSQTAVKAADAAARFYGEQMAAELIGAMNKTVSVAYSANITGNGKKIVAMSPAQKQQLDKLEAEAARYGESSYRAAAQQNFVTLVTSAMTLTGNNSGLKAQ